jgi:hypothetical protein
MLAWSDSVGTEAGQYNFSPDWRPVTMAHALETGRIDAVV